MVSQGGPLLQLASPAAGRGGGGVVCFGFLALFAHQHLCVRSWDRTMRLWLLPSYLSASSR